MMKTKMNPYKRGDRDSNDEREQAKTADANEDER